MNDELKRELIKIKDRQAILLGLFIAQYVYNTLEIDKLREMILSILNK